MFQSIYPQVIQKDAVNSMAFPFGHLQPVELHAQVANLNWWWHGQDYYEININKYRGTMDYDRITIGLLYH